MFNAKSITVVKSKHQRRKINRSISGKNNHFPCNFYAQHGKSYMQSASDFLLTTLTINDTTAPIVIEWKTWHPGIFFFWVGKYLREKVKNLYEYGKLYARSLQKYYFYLNDVFIECLCVTFLYQPKNSVKQRCRTDWMRNKWRAIKCGN